MGILTIRALTDDLWLPGLKYAQDVLKRHMIVLWISLCIMQCLKNIRKCLICREGFHSLGYGSFRIILRYYLFDCGCWCYCFITWNQEGPSFPQAHLNDFGVFSVRSSSVALMLHEGAMCRQAAPVFGLAAGAVCARPRCVSSGAWELVLIVCDAWFDFWRKRLCL